MAKDNDNDDDEDSVEESGQALWDFVARSVKPLKKNNFHPASVDPETDPPVKKGRKQGGRGFVTPENEIRSSSSSEAKQIQSGRDGGQSGAGELDKRLDERLRRGQLSIDMYIDLHGHTQDEARHILQTTLTAAYRAQKRCILVITGKGRHSPREEDSRKLHHGVLKQKVPEWLSGPPLSDIVLKYHGARPKDGGAGALYVLLRRKR